MRYHYFSIMKVYSFILGLLLIAAASSKKSYSGYEVWRIQCHGEVGIHDLRQLIDNFNLDVWRENKSYVDVMIKPDLLEVFRLTLLRNKFHSDVIIPDVGILIKEEEERLAARPGAFSLTDYNTFEDIEVYLSDLAATNDYVSLNSLGKSVENRDLWQTKISVGAGKPSIWIDCNIHAREWITAATCLYGIDLLSNNYGTDPDVTSLLDKYDIYVLPVNNPDGYSFSWSNDRLWRKNRQKYDSDKCYGVDINRNFDDHFGGDGTSGISCAETYRGPSAASEPETQATQNGIIDLRDNAGLAALFSIHSYSQLWMYPYGWTTDLPPNAADLDRVSKIGVDAITAVYGTPYVYGPVAATIYPAAGTTIDYSYSVGIAQSYTLELRDEGLYGFELPADQITPTGEETWAGLIAAILAI